ncbi:hypothetical protein RvY_06833 [Ramazzottius varieornatus]|uniref:Uncharacterized protein n=1 Tax=Ramazzottius varieornatus TaxID=947166 RepID=A0A1D1V8K9_RAMVA|nr:hypothetical protein RvY_06833 [Ramazzottius varieornatus]
MAHIHEVDRQHLSALYDAHVRRHSSTSSSRSGASSRDSSETRDSAYHTLRKQSSPAYLSAGHPTGHSAFSTPSPRTPHHNRSQSVRYPGEKRKHVPSSTHLTLDLESIRPRATSTGSSTGDKDPTVYKLRTFDVTSRGVVKNRGDLYRPKSISSNNTPIGSIPTEALRNERMSVSSAYSTGAETSLSGEGSQQGNSRYKVLMSGTTGVGKTALTNQFLTSEYLNAYDSLSTDEDAMEKSVSVLLDGQESELDFMDPENSSSVYDEKSWDPASVDAHVIVYSVADRPSFEKAIDILFELKQMEVTRHHAIILVGNKTDLVRARVVSKEEGIAVASQYDCKFTETSAGVNHNVDELLVGILTQIRLKEKETARRNKKKRPYKYNRVNGRKNEKRSLTSGYEKAFGMLSRLLARNSLSKSCGNLQVL